MASKKKIIGSGVDVQTAAGVSALTVDETAGSVTIPINTVHAFGNTTVAANTIVDISSAAGATGAFLRLNSGTTKFHVAAYNGAFSIYNTNIDDCAACTTAGSWKFGATTSATAHYMNGDSLVFRKNGNGEGVFSFNDATNTNRWHIGPSNNGAAPAFVVYSSSVGMYMAYGGNAWTAVSDSRSKKNVVPLNLGLEQINSLNPIKYDYISDGGSGSSRVGFIAQEVLQVLPHAVDVPVDSEQMMGLATSDMIPVLVKAIQELSAKLDEANAKIAALEAK